MSQATVEKLQLVLFPGGNPGPEWLTIYDESYRFWKGVWSDTFAKLDGSGTVYSDDFSRQTTVAYLRLGDRCAALGLLHWLDFNSVSARDDSYFRSWSDLAVQKLLREGSRVLVGSNITVAPDLRGSLGDGIRLKDLIAGLMVRALVDTDADVMPGTMRCDRGMQDVAYRRGAQLLEPGVQFHGVPVDLVAFYRRDIAAWLRQEPDLVIERLWRGRQAFGETGPLSPKRTKAA